MQEKTITDLKADVYDLAAEVEQHQRAIQALQVKIQEINNQIISLQKVESATINPKSET